MAALAEIPRERPDCVLMDIMMPELDGHELCRRLRAMPELAGIRLVMVSAKAYHFERRRALEMGADAFFQKPLDHARFAADLQRIVADTLAVGFWGVRGTLPFFAPFYSVGHRIEICGPAQADLSLRELLSAQMESPYFPISVREFAADVHYRELREGEFEIGRERVRTMLLSHPGSCLGYRLEHGGRSLCYVTDNELHPPDSPFHSAEYVEQLADFARGADLLITDCAYTDEEYPQRINYGHSCVSQVVDFAARAEAKRLCLIHHDPDQSDAVVDAKLERGRELLAARGASTEVLAPAELSEIEL